MATSGLSAADQAAVIKAAQQGGLSASQGQQIVSAANNNQTVNVSSGTPVVTGTVSSSGSYTPSSTPYVAPSSSVPTGASSTDQYGRTIAGYYYYNGQWLKEGTPLPGSETTTQTTTPTTTPTTTTTTPTTSTETQTTPTTSTDTTKSASTTQATQQQAALTIPANGSVVDLLNAAGADSSFAARKQLAQQLGIQNYTGTAAQNTELATKYTQMYNSAKGTAVPQNAAEARSALNGLTLAAKDVKTAEDPTQQFIDAYSSMNPIEAAIYQQIATLTSTQSTQTSLVDTYAELQKEQGLPSLNLELADIEKVMSGTEDDIRNEITNAGGFATESQVQALTTARNKTLLKQATYLQNVINTKNDYVNQIMSLTEADRKQVDDSVSQKIGLLQTLGNMAEKLSNAAQSNYQNIVNQVGYQGLASAVQGNPQLQSFAEDSLGLPQGALSNPTFLASENKKTTAKSSSVQGTSTTSTSKGQLSNKQFVELSLQRAGLKYDDALARIPEGKVGVIDNATGQIGYIDPLEYNTKQYTYL